MDYLKRPWRRSDGYIALARKMIVRVRELGPSWLVRRARRELHSPLTGPGHVLHGILRRFYGLSRRHAAAIDSDEDTLFAFYDLLCEPATFDVMFFLLDAERERVARQLRAVHVIFVGFPSGSESSDDTGYQDVVSRAAARDRISNILVPHSWALPSVVGVEVLHNRHLANMRLTRLHPEVVFPNGYSVTLHREFTAEHYRSVLRRPVPNGVRGAFCATDAALAYVDRWLSARDGSGRAVVITIRHYKFGSARNSNLAAWADFARYLLQRGYLPVFVPDTESLADGVPSEISCFHQMTEAAWNLGLRIALYERAILNLGVNNGPAFLFLTDARVRGIMFKMTTPGVPQAEVAYRASLGFEVGVQVPFCTEFQRCVWEDDEFEVIRREFEAMEQRLGGATTVLHGAAAR
jgi:hypothetical protein